MPALPRRLVFCNCEPLGDGNTNRNPRYRICIAIEQCLAFFGKKNNLSFNIQFHFFPRASFSLGGCLPSTIDDHSTLSSILEKTERACMSLVAYSRLSSALIPNTTCCLSVPRRGERGRRACVLNASSMAETSLSQTTVIPRSPQQVQVGVVVRVLFILGTGIDRSFVRNAYITLDKFVLGINHSYFDIY